MVLPFYNTRAVADHCRVVAFSRYEPRVLRPFMLVETVTGTGEPLPVFAANDA